MASLYRGDRFGKVNSCDGERADDLVREQVVLGDPQRGGASKHAPEGMTVVSG